MNDGVAVSVEDVSKRFRLYHDRGTSLKERLVKRGKTRYEDLWALQNVSFEVGEGETVGIIGHNGSGKSTLLKSICGVLQPSDGQIVVNGTIAGLLELGAGFQHELSGRDNIYLNGSMLGLSKKEIDDIFDEIVAFAELEKFIDNQVKFYSSGMYVRLGFAVAVNVNPDVLVIDEVLAVGDERFQRKCLNRIREFQDQGKTIIFVSHAAAQVRAICNRAVVLDQGKVITISNPGEAIRVFRDSLLAVEDRVKPKTAEPGVPVGETSDQGSQRSVRIEQVRLNGSIPGVQPNVKTGEAMKIEVDYHATDAVEGVAFSFELFLGDGGDEPVLMMRSSSDEQGIVFDLDEGHNTANITLPTWPITDGSFFLNVGIAARNEGMMFDWKEKAVSFETVYEGRSEGLVSLPYDISLREQ